MRKRRVKVVVSLSWLVAAGLIYLGLGPTRPVYARERPDATVRVEAVRALGRLGPRAVPGLTRATLDADTNVVREARAALGRLGMETRDGGIVRGPTGKKQLALVFTGHEYAEGAATILDELARHHAKASFFLTGDFVRRTEFAPLVHRMRVAGHLLGPHSDKHLLYCPWEGPQRTLVTPAQWAADIAANGRCLQLAMGYTNALPVNPSGFISDTSYEHYNLEIAEWARQTGMTLVNYTPGTRSNADYTGEADTNFVSSQRILDSIIARERSDPHGLNGFLLLLHLGAGPQRADKFHTRFGELLDFLTAKSYACVRVDELLTGSGSP